MAKQLPNTVRRLPKLDAKARRSKATQMGLSMLLVKVSSARETNWRGGRNQSRRRDLNKAEGWGRKQAGIRRMANQWKEWSKQLMQASFSWSTPIPLRSAFCSIGRMAYLRRARIRPMIRRKGGCLLTRTSPAQPQTHLRTLTRQRRSRL